MKPTQEAADAAQTAGEKIEVRKRVGNIIGYAKTILMGAVMAFIGFMTSIARSIVRPTVMKTAAVTIAIIALAAMWAVSNGKASLSSVNPTEIDAGFFKRWSLNHDNNRTIEMTKNLDGSVTTIQRSKGRAYKVDHDADGALWRPVANQ